MPEATPSLHPEALRPETFAIIGAGRVGICLGVLLQRAGHRIVACSSRSGSSLERAAHWLRCASTSDPAEAAAAADRVLIAVPDDIVERVCGALARNGGIRPGVYVVHTAGSLGPEALAPAVDAGARALAVHPLQAVPDVERGLGRLPGSWYGITCDEDLYPWAAGLVSGIGGRPLPVPAERRVLYHAAAVIASNFLVTLAAMAGDIWGEVDPYLPLLAGTVANLDHLGPLGALTGPVVRGDAGTIRRHLEALHDAAPGVEAAYRALTAQAVRLAEAAGRLSGEAAEGIRELLGVSP